VAPAWQPAWTGFWSSSRRNRGKTAGIKDFIAVLMLYRDHDAAEIEAAAELALNNHIFNSEGIRHMLVYLSVKTTDIVSGGMWGRRPHTLSEPTMLVNNTLE
jgi:hypothetical protein